jgi:hypothetical protein
MVSIANQSTYYTLYYAIAQHCRCDLTSHKLLYVYTMCILCVHCVSPVSVMQSADVPPPAVPCASCFAYIKCGPIVSTLYDSN